MLKSKVISVDTVDLRERLINGEPLEKIAKAYSCSIDFLMSYVEAIRTNMKRGFYDV